MRRVLGLALASLVAAGTAHADDSWAESEWQASTPVTQGLRVAAPGYLWIDGRWYVWSGAFFGSTLAAFPMGSGQGFALAGWASSQGCRYEPALPNPPDVPPTFLIQEGTNVITRFPMFPGNSSSGGRAEMRLTNCQGTNIIAVSSSSGRLVCNNQIAQPFTEAQCPAIARFNARAEVFRNGFEG